MKGHKDTPDESRKFHLRVRDKMGMGITSLLPRW